MLSALMERLSYVIPQEVELAIVGRRVVKSEQLMLRSGKKYEKQEAVTVYLLTDLFLVMVPRKKGPHSSSYLFFNYFPYLPPDIIQS